MKKVVLILTILGAIFSILMSTKWIGDFNQASKAIESIKKQYEGKAGVDVDKIINRTAKRMTGFEWSFYVGRKNAGYLLIITSLIAVFAAVRIEQLGKVGSGIIIASVILPTFLSFTALIAGILQLIAGFLSLKIPKKSA